MEQRSFQEWARKQERRDVELPAIAYRCNGERLGILLTDLTYEGCKLLTNQEMEVGERITVLLMDLGA